MPESDKHENMKGKKLNYLWRLIDLNLVVSTHFPIRDYSNSSKSNLIQIRETENTKMEAGIKTIGTSNMLNEHWGLPTGVLRM